MPTTSVIIDYYNREFSSQLLEKDGKVSDNNNQRTFLNNDQLTKITGLFRNVGVDFGRKLTMDDIETIRINVGSDVCNRLLDSCLNKPDEILKFSPAAAGSNAFSLPQQGRSHLEKQIPQQKTSLQTKPSGFEGSFRPMVPSKPNVSPKSAVPVYRNAAGQMFIVAGNAAPRPMASANLNVHQFAPKFV